MNKKVRLEHIRLAVERLHNCSAFHFATMPVYNKLRGETVWEGDVEAFTLTCHSKAKRANAWSEGTGDRERFFAVLQIPPVEYGSDAVKISIVAQGKK